MRSTKRAAVAITLLVALSSLLPPTVRAATPSDGGSIDRTVIDRLVFNTPLNRFRLERSRAKRTHRWLITATDGCSAPIVGSSGASFNFRLACERHDLAYANYTLLAQRDVGVEWSAELRARVDDQFQRDLQQLCTTRRHSQRLRCDAWAVVFFHAVRLAAGP
jgi:hypothetical protein